MTSSYIGDEPILTSRAVRLVGDCSSGGVVAEHNAHARGCSVRGVVIMTSLASRPSASRTTLQLTFVAVDHSLLGEELDVLGAALSTGDVASELAARAKEVPA